MNLRNGDFKKYAMFLLLDIRVPEWAEWVALDSDGCMFFYHDEPILEMEEEYDPEIYDGCGGRYLDSFYWVTKASHGPRGLQQATRVQNVHKRDVLFLQGFDEYHELYANYKKTDLFDYLKFKI